MNCSSHSLYPGSVFRCVSQETGRIKKPLRYDGQCTSQIWSEFLPHSPRVFRLNRLNGIILDSEEQPALRNECVGPQKQNVKSYKVQLQTTGFLQSYNVVSPTRAIQFVQSVTAESIKLCRPYNRNSKRAFEKLHYSYLQSALLSVSRQQKKTLAKVNTFQLRLLKTGTLRHL